MELKSLHLRTTSAVYPTVLVAGGDLIDALFEDVVQGMRDVARMPGVVDGCAHAFGQTDLTVNALEQQRPQVR